MFIHSRLIKQQRSLDIKLIMITLGMKRTNYQSVGTPTFMMKNSSNLDKGI